MFVLTCDITIGNYRFTQVSEVEINNSWRELNSTCRIALPSLKSQVAKAINPGDAVSITLGYAGVYSGVEFKGYVSRTLPGFPFTVECEDYIYLFKKTNINKNWEGSVTLSEIISYLVSQVKAKYPTANFSVSGQLPDITFDKFRIANGNAAFALQKLKEEYGLASFFQGDVLFCGLANQINTGTEVKYALNYNVIESRLEFCKKEQVRLRVKAIGINKKNEKLETKIGDDDGEQRTIYLYNITNEAQLKSRAQEELNRMKFDGYEGTFLTFGVPYAEPLMVANLKDPQYNDARTGKFLIDTVITTFGQSGFRRVIEPGRRVSV